MLHPVPPSAGWIRRDQHFIPLQCYLPRRRIQSKIRRMTTLTPQAFVDKWRFVQLKERSAYQEHFIDLCHLVGHPTPAEDDPAGTRLRSSSARPNKTGGQGFADVFKRGCFALGIQGQARRSRQGLSATAAISRRPAQSPAADRVRHRPLVVHTNYTNTATARTTITLDDILTAEGLKALRAIFEYPEFFKSGRPPSRSRGAARQSFRHWPNCCASTARPRSAAAHFLIRCLFCLFAEDVGLLPERLFTQHCRRRPAQRPATLCRRCSSCSRRWRRAASSAWSEIPYFNGRLVR